MSGRTDLTLLAAAVMLGACASDPRLDVSSEDDVRNARSLLAQAAEEGPVLLDTNSPPSPLTETEVTALAAQGVPALGVRFTTQRSQAADASYRLVLRFVDESVLIDVRPCQAPAAMPPPELEFLGLAAAFCQGRTRIAEVAGPSGGATADDARRLIWRSTQTLFPDDYEQTYGLRNLF